MGVGSSFDVVTMYCISTEYNIVIDITNINIVNIADINVVNIDYNNLIMSF